MNKLPLKTFIEGFTGDMEFFRGQPANRTTLARINDLLSQRIAEMLEGDTIIEPFDGARLSRTSKLALVEKANKVVLEPRLVATAYPSKRHHQVPKSSRYLGTYRDYTLSVVSDRWHDVFMIRYGNGKDQYIEDRVNAECLPSSIMSTIALARARTIGACVHTPVSWTMVQ